MTIAQALITISAAAHVYHLPPKLLESVCKVESSWNDKAVNVDDGGENNDSLGLCQLQLNTGRWMGFKGTRKQLMTPRINAYYAAKFLAFQLHRYGDVTQAIAAYNSGSCHWNQKGQIRNIKYVNLVKKVWAKLEGRTAPNKGSYVAAGTASPHTVD